MCSSPSSPRDKREGKSTLCDGVWINFLSHSTQSDFIVTSPCLCPLLSQQGQHHYYVVSFSYCIYVIVVLISPCLLYAHGHSWPLCAPSGENHFTIIDSHAFTHIYAHISKKCLLHVTHTHTHILALWHQTSLCLRCTLAHTCSL